jgi:hypothetical protein
MVSVKLLGNGPAGSHAQSRHGLQEAFEFSRVGIEGEEKISPFVDFILREAGFQPFRE